MAILEKLLRAGEGRLLRRLEAIATAVNSIEDHYTDLSDEELRDLTEQYKQRYVDGDIVQGGLFEGCLALTHDALLNSFLAG